MKYPLLIITMLLLFISACSTHQTQVPETGKMPLSINLEPAALHGLNVTLVTVTITKGDFTQQMDLPITGNMASGTFMNLELGTYAIDVSVYEDNTLIATGSGTGTVVPGENSTVYITLHFVPGGLEVVVNWGLPYEESRRVLMIGNSFTYFNGGVNAHLQSLVSSVHPEWNTVISAITAGGYRLEDHYGDVPTMNTIATGNWDLVILQEQSSRPVNDPQRFYQYATLLNEAITQSGALTGFYMTWAYQNTPIMYEPLRDAYNYIGAYLDALVLPAGVAFHTNDLMPDPIILYDTDAQHPNINGTYLVSCLMLAGIWNINPTGNAYIPAGMDATTASTLQQIAWVTILEQNKARNTMKAQWLENTPYINITNSFGSFTEPPLSLAQ